MAQIVVKHLPYDTTEEELRDFVGDIGEIVAVHLRRDPITGHAKSIATVELSSPAAADDAVQRLNHRELRGHRLVVTHAGAGALAADSPMVEIPGRPASDDVPATQPHRPVREQGSNPGRWDH